MLWGRTSCPIVPCKWGGVVTWDHDWLTPWFWPIMTKNQRKPIGSHRTCYRIDFQTMSLIYNQVSGRSAEMTCGHHVQGQVRVFLALLLVACQWEIKDPPVNPSGSWTELTNNLQSLWDVAICTQSFKHSCSCWSDQYSAPVRATLIFPSHVVNYGAYKFMPNAWCTPEDSSLFLEQGRPQT